MDNSQTPRRSFIKKSFLSTLGAGAGMLVLSSSLQSFNTFKDDEENDLDVNNEKEFRMGVMDLPNYHWLQVR